MELMLSLMGFKTVDEIRAEFNAANFPNTIEQDGVGTEVLTSGTETLTGGTYIVQDRDMVYLDIDGVYKQAIADGTIASQVAGIAFRDEKLVLTHGLVDIDTGFAISDTLYLSSATAGAFTDAQTNINVALCLGTFIFFTGFNGNIRSTATQDFDAVVTNVAGVGLFQETQLAIDAVPNFGRILIDKEDFVKTTLDTGVKTIEFIFNGVNTGWTRFAGQEASFRIDFDQVPNNGTWRFEWNGQISNDLPFNASASVIQDEFNLFAGHTGVVVTGDYSAGFVFNFLDFQAQPLPTFLDPGLNEIQRFNFGNVPDDGTITFEYEGEQTLNFPWDDNAADLKIAFEALSSITNVSVTGSFAAQFFEIEFSGPAFDEDGLQPKTDITVVAKDLDFGGAETSVNGGLVGDLPIDPVIVQEGRFAANNLRVGPTAVVITITEVTAGEDVGDEKCLILNSDSCKVLGRGFIKDFEVGVDVNDRQAAAIEAEFVNTTVGIASNNLITGRDFDGTDSLGFGKDLLQQLKVTEHPTNKRRVKISGTEIKLPSGHTLIQTLNSQILFFEGAELDLETGDVYEADGITLRAETFTPSIPNPDKYRWFAVSIDVDGATTDGKAIGSLQIEPSSLEGDTPELAPKAEFGAGTPLAQYYIRGDKGLKEVTRITTGRDIEGSLDGTAFIFEDELGTVGFYIDVDNTGIPVPPSISGTDRQVAITGVVEDDNQDAVAQAVFDTINADNKFRASIVSNRVTVTAGFPTSIVTENLVGGTEEEIAYTDSLEFLAQSFSIGSNENLNGMSFGIRKSVGAIDFKVRMELRTDNAGNPGVVLGFVEVDVADIDITTGLINVDFSNEGVDLSTGVTYWAVARIGTLGEAPSGSVFFDYVNALSDTFAGGIFKETADGGSVWTQKADEITNFADLVFQIDAGEDQDQALGPRAAAVDVDSGFTFEILQQGRDADASGLDILENLNISHLGPGSGGGGGGGGGEAGPTQENFNILNAQVVPLDLANVFFDKTQFIGGRFLFHAIRYTDSIDLEETGEVFVSYNEDTDVWSIDWDSKFDNSGITFGIDANGQVTYTSTNIAGTGYQGFLRVTDITTIDQTGPDDFLLQNNQAVPLDVTNLLFDKAQTVGVRVLFHIFRRTDTQQKEETGELFLSYNSVTDNWRVDYDSKFDNGGVQFQVTSAGQVTYTSSNLTGGNHAGTLRTTDITRVNN
jgi:hypothetical protein